MKSIHTYKHPVEFSVSREKNWKEVVEQIVIVLTDTSYKEKVEKFTNFIQSIKNSIKRFFLETKDMPIEIYDRFTRFSSDDYQQLFQAYANQNTDLYFSVLKNKSFKALHYYITKVFFVDYTVKDASVWIDKLKQKYPLVSNSHFHKLDNKKFKDQCVQSIVDDIDQELWTAAGKVLNVLQQENPESGVYTNMLYTLLQTILIWCSREFLETKFAESRRENAHNSLRDIQERKEKIERMEREKQLAAQSKKTIIQPTRQEQILPENKTKSLTEEQENLIQELEQKMTNRIKIDIKYIERMLKKWWPIYIESLVEDMGIWYAAELLEELIGILQQFDVEIVTWQDKQIEEIIKTIEKPQIVQSEKTEVVLSETLESIKDTPEKLTTELLITVCKELWYRFWDEKEFSSYANKLWLEKEWKTCIAIKKKLIDYLSKPEAGTRLTDWSRSTKTYEKLTFNDFSRMVKQKSTILRLTDHETYDNLVNLHFRKHKRDFDAEILTRRKEWDIDPHVA